jgi:hypothetical protein
VHVDLKMVAAGEVPPDSVQQIAVFVDKAAADFALQMEMVPAPPVASHILVTGAFTVAGGVFTDRSPGRQFFKVPVDGGLPDRFLFVGKMPRYLVNRYVTAVQGPHIVEDALSLPGTILCRTPLCHDDVLYRIGPSLSI